MAVREAAANALAAIGIPRAADLLLDALRRTTEGGEDATAYRSRGEMGLNVSNKHTIAGRGTLNLTSHV